MDIQTEEIQAVAAVAAIEPQPTVAVVGSVLIVEPIVGADRIVLATVDCGDAGTWSGVVPKATYVDQPVLVLLQDALLPADNPRWVFMEQRHWRVRMARFKGVPSECVILPIDDDEWEIWKVGQDVGEQLGITKYSKPLPKELAGVAKGNFPTGISKTDEPNFQRVRGWDELLAGGEWYATEKADGTSCTAYVTPAAPVPGLGHVDDDVLHVCSRNLELVEGDNIYWRMARKYGLERVPAGLALQFEIVGPGVQGNPMGLADNEIRAFTLQEIGTQRKRPYIELVDQCAELKIPTAQLVQMVVDKIGGERTADQLRKMAEIRYSNGRPGEGIVIRALDSTWSLKVINLLYRDAA